MFDVIVVGGGAAGLSAALVLARCRRSVVVCDAGRPRNAAAHAIHGYLTRDGTSPLELLRLGRDEVCSYGVEYRDGEVVAASRHADGSFSAALEDGSTIKARRIVIATGVADVLPAIEGVREMYGRSVWHCPYCDGWEVRDRPLAVYGRGRNGYGLALGLRTWSRDIVLCTDGPTRLRRSELDRMTRLGIGMRSDRILRVEGTDGQLERIIFASGDPLERRGMFFNTGQRQVSQLALQLGCRFNRKGTVVTSRTEETGVPGVYVVGDASHDVQFLIVAAAEGAKAAVRINHEFQEEELD